MHNTVVSAVYWGHDWWCFLHLGMCVSCGTVFKYLKEDKEQLCVSPSLGSDASGRDPRRAARGSLPTEELL